MEHEYQAKNHIVDYIGNRTNILFEGAASAYYHHTYITNFISYLPDPNQLLLAVKEDIEEPIHLAELCALGIIHASITDPLWREIQKAENVLSVNGLLHKLQEKLKLWKEDGDCLVESSAFNEIHEKLFEETDADVEAMCLQALEVSSCAMLLILERQCQDQLPGGKYWDLGEQASSFKNVPATNVIAERDFAQLDLLLRTKPSARTLTHETYIMWVNNKTPEWLNSLPADTKARYMAQARAQSGPILDRYRERMKKNPPLRSLSSMSTSLMRKLLTYQEFISITGAQGLAVPYRGYVELSLEVMGRRFPEMGFLVVRDPVHPPMAERKKLVPAVIGSNVLRDVNQALKSTSESRFQQMLAGSSEGTAWVHVLALYEEVIARKPQMTTEKRYQVRSGGRKPILLPARCSVTIDCTTHRPKQPYVAIVEERDASTLPNGLVLLPTLVRVPSSGRVPVQMVNFSTATSNLLQGRRLVY